MSRNRTTIKARLKFWQSVLDKLQAAYLALIDGGVQRYRIDNRDLTRFDLPNLLDQINEAEQNIAELTALLEGRRPRKAFAIVPRDY